MIDQGNDAFGHAPIMVDAARAKAERESSRLAAENEVYVRQLLDSSQVQFDEASERAREMVVEAQANFGLARQEAIAMLREARETAARIVRRARVRAETLTQRLEERNAILLAKNGSAVGIGMGQVNRVDSAKLAVDRAGDRVRNSVAASDAFFPFADGLEILTAAGVIAIVQPGGSVRDEEVIAAAERAGVAMFFTNTRHFSHA